LPSPCEARLPPQNLFQLAGLDRLAFLVLRTFFLLLPLSSWMTAFFLHPLTYNLGSDFGFCWRSVAFGRLAPRLPFASFIGSYGLDFHVFALL